MVLAALGPVIPPVAGWHRTRRRRSGVAIVRRGAHDVARLERLDTPDLTRLQALDVADGIGVVELVEVVDVVQRLLTSAVGGDRLEEDHRHGDDGEHEDEPGHSFPFQGSCVWYCKVREVY